MSWGLQHVAISLVMLSAGVSACGDEERARAGGHTGGENSDAGAGGSLANSAGTGEGGGGTVGAAGMESGAAGAESGAGATGSGGSEAGAATGGGGGADTGLETCNGLDDDGNEVIDDRSDCWRPIYRWVSGPSRCWGTSSTTAPTGCSGYTLEGSPFVAATQAIPGTFHAVQCSKGADHLIMHAGGGEYDGLVSAGFDCSLELGYLYIAGSGPSGATPYANSCDLYRIYYVRSSIGSHLFTTGDVDEIGECEGTIAAVLTDSACFATGPLSCNCGGLLGYSAPSGTTYSASATYSGSVETNISDCDITTYWNAGGYGGSITLSFPSPQTFSAVQLAAQATPTANETYTLYGTSGGVETQIGTSQQTVPTNTYAFLTPISVTAGSYDALRLQVNGGASWVLVSEVRLIP